MKKISASKKELIDYEQVFWALSHASRRHILMCLSKKNGPMLGGELAEELSCSWPTTTGHLQTLTKAGLIFVEKKGREKLYSLNLNRLSIVEKWVKEIKT